MQLKLFTDINNSLQTLAFPFAAYVCFKKSYISFFALNLLFNSTHSVFKLWLGNAAQELKGRKHYMLLPYTAYVVVFVCSLCLVS